MTHIYREPPLLAEFLPEFRRNYTAWFEFDADVWFDLFSQAIDEIDRLTSPSPRVTVASLPALMAVVIGKPAPQGSMRSVPVGGKAGSPQHVLTSMAKGLKPWRKAVAQSVRAAMNLPADGAHWPMTGPVSMDLTFTIHRPKYVPIIRLGYPAVYPDVDKLARAVLDATMTAGAIADDGQVVRLTARKVYPATSPLALDSPGVRIALYAVTEESVNHG